MFFCPECKKQISEKAKLCPFCGCNIKAALKRQKQQAANDAWNRMSPEEKGKSTATVIFVTIILVVLAILLVRCSNDSSNVSSQTATCKVCHRTYTSTVYGDYNYRNIHCIHMENMCINCYNNWCWAVGKKPKDY